MKKILFFLSIIGGLVACESQEPEFSDFDYTTGYFPYQYPVRTLILGDYMFDNANDNAHKFLISAAMGGVYVNKQDRTFEIEVADDLCENVLFGSTKDTVRVLPSEYYTLSSNNTLVIPAGEFNGNIEVQLNDAFFEDTLAHRLGYVLPIRIVGTNSVDTVLRGKPAVANADPRVAVMWEIEPKDFTMFAINYINKYHGNYLHRGANEVKDGTGDVVESNIYRARYVVEDAVVSLSTTGKDQVLFETNTRSNLYPGVLKMQLTFSDDETCVITDADGSAFPVTGTGKFVEDGDSWGDKSRDAIHISYEFSAGGDTFSATDTLVIRDRGVAMQVFTPELY